MRRRLTNSISTVFMLVCIAAGTLQVVAQTSAQNSVPTMPQIPGTADAMTPRVSDGMQAAALGPKRPGVVRIGVAMPRAQMGQGSSGGFDPGEAVRNSIVSYLSGPAVEVVALTSRVPIQIEAEAKQNECDFVLHTSVKQKKGGGGFGSILKNTAPVVGMIPMVGMAGGAAGAMAGVIAGQVASAAITAAVLAESVKSKDEITFEYRLIAPGAATPLLANTSKAKAKSDGEDVISPQIEQAATAVLQAVVKK